MLQFVRQTSIRIVIEETPSGPRRGFLFKMAAGFQKEIDPQSGISVNLVSVDRWLQELKRGLESSSLSLQQKKDWRSYVLQQAQDFLLKKANEEGAQLVSLQFHEERGGGFGWKAELKPDEYLIKLSQMIEVFQPHEDFDLVRVDFIWKCNQNQNVDLKKMGRKLVRHCSRKGAEHFVEALQRVVGGQFSDGARLSEIELHYLGQGHSLKLDPFLVTD